MTIDKANERNNRTVGQYVKRCEALSHLNVKTQTLYSYVSRNIIKAKADPQNPGQSLYSVDDINAILSRRARGRKLSTVAHSTIAWGEPLLETQISTVRDGRLYYRGSDALVLSQTARLEDVIQLLWDIDRPPLFAAPSGQAEGGGESEALIALARRVGRDPADTGRSAAALQDGGLSVFASLAAAFGALQGSGVPVHIGLTQHWRCSLDARDMIRRTLVLLADHELNASTFAVRVTASTGASMSACLLSGLATLSGPLHGKAPAQVETLVTMAEEIGIEQALAKARQHDGLPPGFGHPLYPHGDPRALELLRRLELPPIMQALAEAQARHQEAAPNIDFALTALRRRHAMPAHAPFVLFALSRAVGWVAHAIEQHQTGQLIRPRARYVGDPPP